MFQDELNDFVEATATKFGIPGVAVGVCVDGKEYFACDGVTSLENPLPVDTDTLFTLGSVTKTFTATTVMRLAAEGRLEMDAPARRYLPELRLADDRVARELAVSNLLNHTSGLDWGLLVDTGEGNDALATYVAKMAELKLLFSPGTRASYSQAGYNLAGRIVETVTGLTFEGAVGSLVLEPLRLAHTFFARDDVMTRRFAVGHDKGERGALRIARMWKGWRGDAPGAGLASSVSDLVRWARFHLGDGRTEDGFRLLPGIALHQMQDATTPLRGSNLGDAIGLGWFLRDVDGVRTIGHAGSASGQFAEILFVPERQFAIAVLSNAAPDGLPFNQAAVRWALQAALGVKDRDPEPLAFDHTRAREVIGAYENNVMTLTIGAAGSTLRLEVLMKPEIRAALSKQKAVPPDHAPFDMGLLPGDGDEFVITSGAFKGQRGFFTRDAAAAIVGVDLGGRLFERIAPQTGAGGSSPRTVH
jgi:CubicO group peptidase (beta-lactamase class C family)